jgi:hypothetical protein
MEAKIGKRGDQWLSEDDLKAHLASLVRLENVGMFLGAGSSCGNAGGKSLKAVWADFSSTHPDDVNWLKGKGYDVTGPKVNVEELLDNIELTLKEWKRSKFTVRYNQLARIKSNLLRGIIKAALLEKSLWSSPASLDDIPSSLISHCKVLQKLCTSRQPGQSSPWVFTTNYDLAIEWAAEALNLQVINGFSGLHLRSFSPHNFDLGFRNIKAQGEARFGTYNIYLGKLHGSLSWQLNDDELVIEESAYSLKQVYDDFLNGKTQSIDKLLVYPGVSKYFQTTGFVFSEVFRRFSEFLSSSHSALIINGYSFRDNHLNRLLKSALHNPTLQIVIFLPELKIDSSSSELSWDIEEVPNWVKKLLALNIPQVTFVGEGAKSFFDELPNYLPDPAIYDEHSINIKENLKKLKGLSEDKPIPRPFPVPPRGTDLEDFL